MVDRIARFVFRAKRKLGRELRLRSLSRYEWWDRKRLQGAMGGTSARELLLEFGQLAPWAGNGVVPPRMEEWADPGEAEAIVAAADRGCAHVFDLLGSGEVHLGSEIDWHLEFKSGYRWPDDQHHLGIRWDDAPEGTDIKVPWELSRCMQFATFGFADWITGDEKYYREFKAQVRSWIGSNRYDRGVNWMCAMDVAIRSVNWLNAVMMFRHRLAEDEDGEFCAMLAESLWLHGVHISRNLEWQGPRSRGMANHFLADLVGLLAVGALFSGSREGARHRAFASKWLENEVRRQVFEDGSLYETSTSYHRLSFEMFLWAGTLGERLGSGFSQTYQDRLGRMASFVKAYTAPSGAAAQFGDNDSGRLLTAGIDEGPDHRYLTDGGCGVGGGMNRLLLGVEVGGPVADRGRTTGFPDGGYWFLRSGQAWAGVRAGVVSHHGAHAHCDQLSFVFSLGGEDFIVDPGTGVYSADASKRNRYRSSNRHNACRVNRWEANSFRGGKSALFRMNDDTKTEILDWQVEGSDAAIAGRHHGYERFREGLIYERSLVLRPDCLEIRDRFESLESGDQMDWSFHFAPQVDLAIEDGSIVARSGSREIRIIPNSGIESEIADSHHSPGYGVEVPAVRLLLRAPVPQSGRGEHGIRIEWDPAPIGANDR